MGGSNLAVVKILVEAGADVDSGGDYSNSLQDAAEAGKMEIIRYLLKKGAHVNAEGKWNRTALLNAVQEGRSEVVQLLLEHGADWRPKIEESGPDDNGVVEGDDALHLAKHLGHRKIVEMLKRAGAKE